MDWVVKLSAMPEGAKTRKCKCNENKTLTEEEERISRYRMQRVESALLRGAEGEATRQRTFKLPVEAKNREGGQNGGGGRQTVFRLRSGCKRCGRGPRIKNKEERMTINRKRRRRRDVEGRGCGRRGRKDDGGCSFFLIVS
jgi:hypothetical protein